MAGIEAQLSFKAKAGSEDYSIFSILADYRFLLDSLPLYFSVDLKRKRAWFWPGHGQVLEKKNLSINGGYNDIALIRSGNQFSLFVNDIKIYSVKQNARRGPASAKDSLNSATFALKIDQTELSNSVTFDKLLYTGKRGPEKKAVTEEFSLAGEKYLFTVIGDAHLDDWRKGQAKVSATFIQQAYRVYGVPPISRFMGMVQAKGVYYESGYGANNHGIIYTTAFADNVNSINHHELSHNWAHLYKQRWNTEGSANLPYAIHLEKSEKKLMLSN